MTIHRFHPDPEKGDPDDPILWDDCERCREHAEDPRSLDAPNLRRLLDATVKGYFDERPTENEQLAQRSLWRALLLVERTATAYRGERVLWQGMVLGAPIADEGVKVGSTP